VVGSDAERKKVFSGRYMSLTGFKLDIKPEISPGPLSLTRFFRLSPHTTYYLLPAFMCCLAVFSASLYAGGSRNLLPADFALGTSENLETTDSNMTLVKRWTFGGQGPMAARRQPGFAFDEIRNLALVFGGMDANGAALGDTWLLGSGWTQQTPAGPPAPRYGHGLVWMGDKFLMFGGSSGNDTWTYDIVSDTWTSISASPAPPWRLMPAMAYDPDLGKVVMLGGVDDSRTWIYNIAGSSWTALNLSPAPSPRAGASMAYDRVSKKMVLFGGKRVSDGALLDDTWTFDPASLSWTDKAPSSRPEARWQGAMVYDPVNGSVLHYGGFTSGYTSDIWFYNFAANKWSNHYEYNPDKPGGHYGHGLVYDVPNRRAVIFGGMQDVAVKSVWIYSFLSTGSWTSAPLDIWAGYSSTTTSTWDSISAEFSDKPADTGVFFQLASSPDGTAYDLFRGPDGSIGTFYSAGAPVTVWSGHNNRRFMKVKADFFSNDPPGRPKVSLFNIAYNRAPYAPALVSPENGGRTNDSTPLFKWSLVSDADSDAVLLYQIQVDSAPEFSSPDISGENIAAGAADVSFATGTILPEGVWYWRARARDPAGLYGDWSGSFSVTVDTTTPPGAVTAISAARGAAINSVRLTWNFPGDDKGRVDNGIYRVRFSPLGEILTDGAWLDAAATESSGLFSAAPGETVQTTVTGFADATTYYFAVKTQDELGNLSPVSAVSPFTMTDSSPTISLISPNAGGLIIGTTVIAWTQSDANSGDSITKRILISTDSGASYSIQIASGITPGATFYLWHSPCVLNGSAYRIKVEAVDQRGLYASDSSDLDFETDNTNEPPSVYFISAPAAGEEVYSGSLAISWGVSDTNSMDTHTYNILLSVNSGGTFTTFVSGYAGTSYTFDTKIFANLSTYQLKILAADSGTPQLTAAVLSPVFTILNSLPPKAFNLIKPLDESFPAVFDLKFSWTPAIDPEGSAVTYTLQYSTTAGPEGGISVPGLIAAEYTPPLDSLISDAQYFWKVTARDQYGKTTDSPSGSFMLSRTKARSPDGMLLVEILSGMPAQGCLSFQDAGASLAGVIEQADRNSKGNRLVNLLSYPIWDVQARDVSGSVLSGAAITARVTFTVPEAARPGGLDAALADLRHLKISRLDETLASWNVPSPQLLVPVKKQVSVLVSGLSVFSVIAALTPTQILSGLTNFPNPFAAGRETTRIRYVLTGDSAVRIRIYTQLGDLVRVLDCPAGTSGCGKGDPVGLTNEIIWDGKNGEGRTVANGVYPAEIRAKSAAGEQKEIRHIGVLK